MSNAEKDGKMYQSFYLAYYLAVSLRIDKSGLAFSINSKIVLNISEGLVIALVVPIIVFGSLVYSAGS